MFPGALELLTQIGPCINQYPSYVTNEPIPIDDSDTRSVTMSAEPSPSTQNRPESNTSMGPPPRPVGLLTLGPATPTKGRNGDGSGGPGPSTIYDMPNSPPRDDTDHGPLSLQQTAKRSLDTLGTEASPSTGSPTKRAKKAAATQPVSPVKVTRTIDWWEVEGVEYIFKDKLCRRGWYAIRCNIGRQPGINPPGSFVKRPLEGNTALNHFNEQGHTCHDTSKKYTIDEIIRDFAHRVIGNGLTEARVNSANEKLHATLEQNATKGSAKKSRKGKEKAVETETSFIATNIRSGTSDTDDSYRESVRTYPYD
ncbi:hypothetical protein VM1G_09172 [Cytospora mali]|uniref:Uncharacterized protein n=1 Tax=Cytospora mali TaxID=578113 RepID=A0A194WBN9_CYTMA|nr:hypothetical protein VM1G_09172 [Valsa mali]